METIRYDPTPADYAAATRAHYFRMMRSRRWIARLGLVTLVLCAIYAALLAWLGEPNLLAWVSVVAVLLIATVLLGSAINLARIGGMMRRQFAQQPLYAEPFEFGWSESGLTTRGPIATASVEWRQLHRWHEAASCLLFYLSERNYLFVPKRVLSDEQLAGLRAALAGTPRF